MATVILANQLRLAGTHTATYTVPLNAPWLRLTITGSPGVNKLVLTVNDYVLAVFITPLLDDNGNVVAASFFRSGVNPLAGTDTTLSVNSTATGVWGLSVEEG